MPAGASSGVDEVTTGSGGDLENSAMGTWSPGVVTVPSDGGVDFPQLQGAYQDPLRMEDAVKTTLGALVAPVLHPADCNGLFRHDGAERPAVRGSEENCGLLGQNYRKKFVHECVIAKI